MNLAVPSHFLPWLFPKLLGSVYFLAFSSLLIQIRGLCGSQGILPIRLYLADLKRSFGSRAFRFCPTLFWLDSSDRTLTGCALLGIALSLLLMAGAPAAPLLLLLWLIYLTFASTCQEFLSYQWDALLLEAGFMTIFLPLADPASPLVVFAYRFFLFRFMLSAGVVKLRSGDPTWRDLTALTYHYETQPLPNRIGWYAHHLPRLLQKFSTFGTFFFELAVPFLVLGPAPARLTGVLLLLFFQLLIFATGNYGFFNILAMVLLVPLLDDRQMLSLAGHLPIAAPAGGEAVRLFIGIIFTVFLILNICQLLRLFFYLPAPVKRLLAALSPFMISNSYGLFAVMTTNRFEFVIEGSDDGENWQAYEFRWKPGDSRTPPRQAAPHQPRLDWQMWFAALNPRIIEPWLENLVVRLLEGSRPVLALFRHNPFPDAPPKEIRLNVYRYHFSSLKARRNEGVWWERTLLGRFPPMALKR
jgi:hypothetical protein